MDTSSINAQSIFDDNAAMLKLSWLTGHEGWERGFSADTVANATSSADLVGHLNLIHPNRIQVLGEAEIDYYQRQTDEDRSRHMAELIALEPPFLVVAGGAAAPPELVLRCTRSSTPLFTTPMSAAAVIDSLRLYMSRILAPRATLHGVFLDILGMGVLLTGDSGLGKSELGLELISRATASSPTTRSISSDLAPISSKGAARRCCRICSKCAASACSTSRRSSAKPRCAGK